MSDEFEIDTDPARVDVDAVWRFLSTEAYWQRWRSRADVETQMANAWRMVGAYRREGGELVGFARATSDGVSFAYLADVFVLPQARGQGLAQRMLTELIETEPGRNFRWALHTMDAHGLYARYDFAPPDDRYLERPGPHGGRPTLDQA